MKNWEKFLLILMIFPGVILASEKPTEKTVKPDLKITSINLRASTLGLGLEGGHIFGSYRIRLAGHFFNFKREQKIGEIDYEIDAELRYASLLLDWRPSGGKFFLSTGLIYNADTITAQSLDATAYFIGGHLYPAGDTGRLLVQVEYPALAPYLGLGWDGKFSSSHSLGWMMEFGVAYFGKSQVTLETQHTPSGLPGSAQWENDISQEILILADYFDQFKFFPVISLGLNYSF